MKRVSAKLLTLTVGGIMLIAGQEGFRDHIYIPVPGDLPTGGFGHADKRLVVGDHVSVNQAVQWLAEDTKEAQLAVQRCVKVPITQAEFDAYVSFAYNVGETNFCSSTLVKKLNAGNYEGACNELKRWVYAGGVKYNGLVNRRKIESMLCKTGTYPESEPWLMQFQQAFEAITNGNPIQGDY